MEMTSHTLRRRSFGFECSAPQHVSSLPSLRPALLFEDRSGCSRIALVDFPTPPSPVPRPPPLPPSVTDGSFLSAVSFNFVNEAIGFPFLYRRPSSGLFLSDPSPCVHSTSMTRSVFPCFSFLQFPAFFCCPWLELQHWLLIFRDSGVAQFKELRFKAPLWHVFRCCFSPTVFCGSFHPFGCLFFSSCRNLFSLSPLFDPAAHYEASSRFHVEYGNVSCSLSFSHFQEDKRFSPEFRTLFSILPLERFGGD